VRDGGRIGRRFAQLKHQGRSGLVAFVTAGDPDLKTSIDIVRRLPAAGADLIELGMPFSDPMADGPTIQASSERALRAGQTMRRTLDMVATFRRDDGETPIVLMGYYNPIYAYGPARFIADARKAGADGLILVDLPPEEAEEVASPATAIGMDLIFLAAPTTPEERLPLVLRYATGFLYYVSITGITGTTSADVSEVGAAVERIRRHTTLPVAVGFGIKTPDQARLIAGRADAAVVGSAIVAKIAQHLAVDGTPRGDLVEVVSLFVGTLAGGVRRARVAGPAA
jgi:tryptophan synthase alpha chain